VKPIQVFEHREYKVGNLIGDTIFKPEYLKKLQEFHGRYRNFYSLTSQGVKFCEYVGVLKIGDFVIEVLPKTDDINGREFIWQQFLMDMLRVSGLMEIEETGFTTLKLKQNSILDLYMELFLKEVRYLMHTGLVKKYRKTEGNIFVMKGSLVFDKNIRQNLTHAERFYMSYSIYDKDNIFNSLLLKAITLISKIGSQSIYPVAQSILLDFPECQDIKVSETVFERLHYDRKSERYRKALNMAKLLLLNYHPDIQNGNNDVLALMFNMNELWEKYVFKKLRKQLHQEFRSKYEVKEQVINHFWQPIGGYMRKVKPDIVVVENGNAKKTVAVLDTKWKNLTNNRPDDADLKQMLVYNLYNSTSNSALLYPSSDIGRKAIRGTFEKNNGNCCLIFLPLVVNAGRMELRIDNVIGFIEDCCVEMNKTKMNH
jgi:5-methylcytosine-specific restriction enzyme subunit McrC